MSAISILGRVLNFNVGEYLTLEKFYCFNLTRYLKANYKSDKVYVNIKSEATEVIQHLSRADEAEGPRGASDHAEALAALVDGPEQCVHHLLVAVVVGQAELVEAGVGRGQGAEIGRGGDLEARAELLEAAGRQLRAAGGELQQPRALLAAEVGQRRPEPAQQALPLVPPAGDQRVRAPIRHAHLARAAHQQLPRPPPLTGRTEADQSSDWWPRRV